MSDVKLLIESVLEQRFGVKVAEARWKERENQWLASIHGSWLKIDITGEGFGDLLVITVLVGHPPENHLAEFHALLLEKNLELPGPSLWVKDSLFGLREVRYTDGLQDIELVDMLELMSEVARETKEELSEIYDKGLILFEDSSHQDLMEAVAELGGWI
jgi:hypothetical protein